MKPSGLGIIVPLYKRLVNMRILKHSRSLSVVVLAADILIVAMVCPAQSAQKKSVQKRLAENSFKCPDQEAQQACKSYAELLKAKDTSLPPNAYVCFRKNVDEFFLVTFSQPIFHQKWDADLKQMVSDYEYNPPGRGSARTFQNGIEDASAMPSFFFSGQWSPGLEAGADKGMFFSDKINSKSHENDSDVGVTIDENQVNVGYKYKNKLEKNILYTLAIQRSTGRFAEHFYEEGGKIPFSERVGYCVHRTE